MFGFLQGVRDTAEDAYYEVRDAVIEQQEAPDDLLVAATPADRWFSPSLGWPSAPEELAATGLPIPAGYKVTKWEAPDAVCPNQVQEPFLFDKRHEGHEQIGELRIEVLQAEALPNSLLQMGAVDPYALVIFEGSGGRTNHVRNDTTPRWGVDAPRAFQFPVTCPYATLHVALMDEDQLTDDPLGRVVIDISQFYSGTTYDCWWPLQYGMLKRHVTKRGSVRLRISVVWNEDRTRLAHYPKLLPTFIVPLVDGKAKYATMFATQGRYANPYRFKTSVFKAHATDLKRAIADATAKLCDFFFWRWPFLSIFVGIVWQLVVSYPTFFPVIVPFTGLGALVRGYFDLPAKPRSLETKLSFSQLLVILLCNHREPPLRAQAAASVDEEEANSEGDSDSDEDEDDSKRLKKTRSANAPSAASAAARKRRPPNWMPDVDSVRDVLPTFIPDPGSLQEAQDQVFWETEQEIRAEFCDFGFTLNPLAPILGPVQAMLHNINVQVRVVRRMLAWDDRILTFQLCLALVAMSIVFILLGVAFTYVPWAAVAEWTFRILGLALFGPHMRWVGRSVRGRWADYVRQSDEYEDGDAETRKRMLEEHKVWCEATIGQMVQREVHGTLPDPDVLELEAALAKKYRTVVVNPRPIAAKLRYVHRPDFTRSVAYPMPPMLASRSDTHRGFATVAYQA